MERTTILSGLCHCYLNLKQTAADEAVVKRRETAPKQLSSVLCVGSWLWALPSRALSLKAQECIESLKKSLIVTVKILMLRLIINNLWFEEVYVQFC